MGFNIDNSDKANVPMSLDDLPLISIIIPCYNVETYIEKTISSVLNQTYENFEAIIVDDGSSDNTVKIIESFSDKRIKLFCQSNRGSAAARNRGLEVASGDYISFLDADDLLVKHKVERQVQYLLSHIGTKVCYCGSSFTVRDSIKISNTHVFSFKGKILFEYLYLLGLITTNDWMINSEVIKKNDLKFKEGLSIGEDLHFFLRMLSLEKAGCVEEALTIYRRRNRSLSTTEYNLEYFEENNYIIEFQHWLHSSDTIYSSAEIHQIINLLDTFFLPLFYLELLFQKGLPVLDSVPEGMQISISKFKFNRKQALTSLKYVIKLTIIKSRLLRSISYKLIMVRKSKF